MTEFVFSLRYTIEFTSAFHIGAGYGLAGMVDATPVRRNDGNLYVPGASVKGRARWRLTGLLGRPWDHDLEPCRPAADQPVCPVCNLFGSTWQEAGLCFGDAVLEDDLAALARQKAEAVRQELAAHELADLRQRSQVERRSQVSLSRRRRVAREELLFVTEVGQAGLRFRGSIEGVLPDAGRTLLMADSITAPVDLGWLMLALRSIEQLGGRKSRGLGHCQISITRLNLGQQGGELKAVAVPDDVLRALGQEACQ